MKLTTSVILLAAFGLLIAYLIWERQQTHPTTAAVDDANNVLGASMALGGNMAPSRYGANTPWLYPPPLAFMMPVATAGDRASVTG